MSNIAIIGAGLSGLACAQALVQGGKTDITVFDKGRGPGGRMSSRRLDAEGNVRFDHGAQYFTAHTAPFRAQVETWLNHGIVARWDGRIRVLDQGTVSTTQSARDRYVGVPSMNAVIRHLTHGLDVSFGVRIKRLTRLASGAWNLKTTDGTNLGEFSHVVLALPAPQTAALLPEKTVLKTQASQASMNPCWAVMATWATPLELPFDGAFVHNSPLSWIARDSSKPGRASGERWVLHAHAKWSKERLEWSSEAVLSAMLQALQEASPTPLPTPSLAIAHRWRYAIPAPPLEVGSLYETSLGLGLCGDWCTGARVEGAFSSGLHLARTLLS